MTQIYLLTHTDLNKLSRFLVYGWMSRTSDSIEEDVTQEMIYHPPKKNIDFGSY